MPWRAPKLAAAPRASKLAAAPRASKLAAAPRASKLAAAPRAGTLTCSLLCACSPYHGPITNNPNPNWFTPSRYGAADAPPDQGRVALVVRKPLAAAEN